jgi:hypothetical protein
MSTRDPEPERTHMKTHGTAHCEYFAGLSLYDELYMRAIDPTRSI